MQEHSYYIQVIATVGAFILSLLYFAITRYIKKRDQEHNEREFEREIFKKHLSKIEVELGHIAESTSSMIKTQNDRYISILEEIGKTNNHIAKLFGHFETQQRVIDNLVRKLKVEN